MISHKLVHKSRVISIIGMLSLLSLVSCEHKHQVTIQPENKQQDPDLFPELKQQNKTEDLSETKGITEGLVWKGIQSDDEQLATLNEDNTKPINLEYVPTEYSLNGLSCSENKASTNPLITPISSLSKIPLKLTQDTQASSASLEGMHIEASRNSKPKALSEQKRPDLGDLIILPRDVLKTIMSYVGLEATSQVRQLNRSFYELMTGYNQPGLLGVRQKPQFSMHAELWKANKFVDFRKKEYQALTPTTIPSFSFCQLVGEVRNLPTSFWPYLKETNVQKLNLYLNQVGAQGAAELAKYLKGTNVHTLNLGYNQIGDQGVAELAKYLKGTNVHTLNLGYNQIGDQGVAELAKYLKGTNVHTLDLGCNQIGAQGAADLAKYLEGTNVQELNLNYNQIGVQGAAELAKYLEGINVHTLNLVGNRIGDQGVLELAKYLEGTNVHKLDLGYNQIGDQGVLELAKYLESTNVQKLNLRGNDINVSTQTSLKKQYLNIRWIF